MLDQSKAVSTNENCLFVFAFDWVYKNREQLINQFYSFSHISLSTFWSLERNECPHCKTGQ